MSTGQSGRQFGREKLMRSAKAAQFMPTERAEIAAMGASECLADHDRQIESLRHGLDPADEVDRGADHGEIEPRGGADIAVDDGPAVGILLQW